MTVAIRQGVRSTPPSAISDGATAPFLRWARQLAEHGLQRVAGAVLGNDDCQPDEIMGEGWSPAPASRLSTK